MAFWNRKPKLPITPEDKTWVDESLDWLLQSFGEEHCKEIVTITPTKNFYNRTFEDNEEDAVFILERTKEFMNIYDTDIALEFFSDEPVRMDDGTTLSSPADIMGSWNSAAGTYQVTETNDILISIEKKQLKNPISLIATIAHELAHQVLLGENRIDENDEYLTDLTAIFYGFGIFLGNSRFSFSSFNTNFGSGWQTSNQGYLPEQLIAYAMARLAIKREEDITLYTSFLNTSMSKFFKQCVTYLKIAEQTT
jgi:hypothetical protein